MCSFIIACFISTGNTYGGQEEEESPIDIPDIVFLLFEKISRLFDTVSLSKFRKDYLHCGESKTQRKWFLDEKRDGLVDENRNNQQNETQQKVYTPKNSSVDLICFKQ